MSRDYSKKDYHMLISKLREEYSNNPKKANLVAYNILYKNGKIKSEGLQKFFSNFGVIVILLLIPLLLIGDYNKMIALAGLAFFSAIYMVLMSPDNNVIIFIYSHGLLGYIMMNAQMFSGIINSPVFRDGKSNLLIVLGVAVVFLLVQCIYATLYCLSDDLRDNPFNRSIPVICGAISTAIIHLTYIYLI